MLSSSLPLFSPRVKRALLGSIDFSFMCRMIKGFIISIMISACSNRLQIMDSIFFTSASVKYMTRPSITTSTSPVGSSISAAHGSILLRPGKVIVQLLHDLYSLRIIKFMFLLLTTQHIIAICAYDSNPKPILFYPKSVFLRLSNRSFCFIVFRIHSVFPFERRCEIARF